jgi:hypothetical protein
VDLSDHSLQYFVVQVNLSEIDINQQPLQMLNVLPFCLWAARKSGYICQV